MTHQSSSSSTLVNTTPSRDRYSAFVTPLTTPKKKRSHVQFAQPQNDSDDEMLGSLLDSPLLKLQQQEKLKKVEEKKPSKAKAKPEPKKVKKDSKYDITKIVTGYVPLYASVANVREILVYDVPSF